MFAANGPIFCPKFEYERRLPCPTLPQRRLGRAIRALRPRQLASVIQPQQWKGIIMKRTILSLACAAIAPLAFAQTSTTTTESTTTNPVTTESTTTTFTDGTVTTFEPGKTIVVRRE